MTPLLPPNATNLERALAYTVQLPALPMALRDLWNPDTCPLALLPWLAWSLSVDLWDSDWSEETKRDHVRQSIAEKYIKGTVASVEAVLGIYDDQVTLTEWFNQVPQGAPYTFDLNIDIANVDPLYRTSAYATAVYNAVKRTKPERAHFTFTQHVAAQVHLAVVAAARAMTFVRLTLQAESEAGSMPDGFAYITVDGSILTDGDNLLIAGTN